MSINSEGQTLLSKSSYNGKQLGRDALLKALEQLTVFSTFIIAWAQKHRALLSWLSPVGLRTGTANTLALRQADWQTQLSCVEPNQPTWYWLWLGWFCLLRGWDCPGYVHRGIRHQSGFGGSIQVQSTQHEFDFFLICAVISE